MALMAALGLVLSCGGPMYRNSEYGSTVDAGFFGPEAPVSDCSNCAGGNCCGSLCCDAVESCCMSATGPRCVRMDVTGGACTGAGP